MRQAVRAILIHDSQRGLFVQHDERQVLDRGKWGTPGGGIEPGEDHRSALLRELEEEFGATFAAGLTIGPHLRTNERPDRVDHFYAVWFAGGAEDVRITAPDEILDYGWFTPDEADRLVLFFGFEAELCRQACALASSRASGDVGRDR